MAGTSLPATANLFAADGAVSPARAAAPAQDALQRVDPVTAVALQAAKLRRCWIVNRSDRAGSSKPPVPRFPDFRSPAETLGRTHLPRVRTEWLSFNILVQREFSDWTTGIDRDGWCIRHVSTVRRRVQCFHDRAVLGANPIPHNRYCARMMKLTATFLGLVSRSIALC